MDFFVVVTGVVMAVVALVRLVVVAVVSVVEVVVKWSLMIGLNVCTGST